MLKYVEYPCSYIVRVATFMSENHPTRERRSPRRMSPFLVWGDFLARSRFAPSTIPEEKWGTTRSLLLRVHHELAKSPALKLA